MQMRIKSKESKFETMALREANEFAKSDSRPKDASPALWSFGEGGARRPYLSGPTREVIIASISRADDTFINQHNAK